MENHVGSPPLNYNNFAQPQKKTKSSIACSLIPRSPYKGSVQFLTRDFSE